MPASAEAHHYQPGDYPPSGSDQARADALERLSAVVEELRREIREHRHEAPVVFSPNGTPWSLSVGDDGCITATVAGRLGRTWSSPTNGGEDEQARAIANDHLQEQLHQAAQGEFSMSAVVEDIAPDPLVTLIPAINSRSVWGDEEMLAALRSALRLYRNGGLSSTDVANLMGRIRQLYRAINSGRQRDRHGGSPAADAHAAVRVPEEEEV